MPAPGEASEAWSRHARTYARVAAPCTGFVARTLFQTVAGRLPPAPHILDVACGTGELSHAAVLHCLADLEATGRRGRVVATDFAPDMVRLAALNLTPLGADSMLECEVQDGQALRYEADSFDAVFSSFGIFLFPDRGAGWREAARVLKPGGLLATSVWRGPQHNALARLQIEPVVAALPERLRASMPKPAWLEIASEEGLARELSEAGFGDVEVSVFDAVFTAPSPRAMWDVMRDNPAISALFSQCNEAELQLVEKAVLKRFVELAGGADRPLRFDASCHFAVARRG